KKHAVVLVLGDVGRSPRMQYHALSLLEQGHYVTLIGYAGEGLIPPLEKALTSVPSSAAPSGSNGAPCSCHQGHFHVLRMKPRQPPRTNPLFRLLYYPLRLASLLPVDVILVQNPPSVPTLLLAYLYCIWQSWISNHRPRFVIDWHNLGYTMFDSPNEQTPPLRRIFQTWIRALAKRYERFMAPLADAHLCVTQAMELWLGENFNVHGQHVRVLYDKPPLLFRPTNMREDGERVIEETLFTEAISIGQEDDEVDTIRLRSNRPALLVSSTSWTPDEDFSILLEALEKLHLLIESRMEGSQSTSPRVLVLVTGKGPQKAHYLPLLHKFNHSHPMIQIHTLWLEAVDYPKLLGCATLGISLHTSTSGLDLPMKVLDMFGCQVPVCAIGFDCLGELVKDKVNGRVFTSDEELATQLFELLDRYPDNNDDELEKYRTSIRGMTRWKENWEECARHL
ncbi:beta-1,4 mannosyltransferase, partial [Thalassiosira pseudonana CCMP1335]